MFGLEHHEGVPEAVRGPHEGLRAVPEGPPRGRCSGVLGHPVGVLVAVRCLRVYAEDDRVGQPGDVLALDAVVGEEAILARVHLERPAAEARDEVLEPGNGRAGLAQD